MKQNFKEINFYKKIKKANNKGTLSINIPADIVEVYGLKENDLIFIKINKLNEING